MLSLCSPTTPPSSFPHIPIPWVKLHLHKPPKYSHCQHSEHLSPHLALFVGHSWAPLKGPLSIQVLFVFCLSIWGTWLLLPFLGLSAFWDAGGGVVRQNYCMVKVSLEFPVLLTSVPRYWSGEPYPYFQTTLCFPLACSFLVSISTVTMPQIKLLM